MFPISDDNPPLAFPIITILIIGACVAIYAWEASLGLRGLEAAFYAYGFIPANFFGAGANQPIPAPATLFTSMFMHGDLLHLLGNMWFLWIFGDNVEGALGKVKFVVFYLICGVAAALTQGFIDPDSAIPLVGASGAISGVLGAYLLLYPYAMVRTALVFIVFVRILYVPAALVLGLWFVFQLLSGAATGAQEGGGVAFWAHVGGFVAGVLLVPFFKRSDVALFAPPHHRSFEIGPWGPRG